MRALALALILALSGAPVLAETEVALQKLADLKQRKHDLANRHRATVFILNETPVTGIEPNLKEEAVLIFASNSHEIVNHPEAAAIAAAHAKTPFTTEELARLADQLDVETIAVGTVKDYRAKRDIGLPLPTMSVRVEARVKMEAFVYKRSSNSITWQDSLAKVHRQFVGGGIVKRNATRRRTSESIVDNLFSRYFAQKH